MKRKNKQINMNETKTLSDDNSEIKTNINSGDENITEELATKAIENTQVENNQKVESEEKITQISEETTETSNEDKLADCCKALAEQMNDRYLRLLAEFDNYRKRVLKEREELIKSGSIRLIKDILFVLDDLERAINTSSDEEKRTNLYEGIELITKKFKTTLEAYGLEYISCVGEYFDSDLHEAISSVEVTDEQKEKIIEEVQKGYKIHGQVIRHAKVIVGK